MKMLLGILRVLSFSSLYALSFLFNKGGLKRLDNVRVTIVEKKEGVEIRGRETIRAVLEPKVL
jgi:hypothetical protein